MYSFSRYLNELLPSSGFVLCPGVTYADSIRFKTKNLIEYGPPFNKKCSNTCLLWHVPNNSRLSHDHVLFNCCQPCKTLHNRICALEKRAEKTPVDQWELRLRPSSNYPISKLSPASQKVRHSKIAYEKRQLFVKVNCIESDDYNLNDKQHNELLQIVKEIQRKGSESIKELIKKGQQAQGNMLEEAWKQDVMDRIEFEKDQRKAGTQLGTQFVICMHGTILLFYSRIKIDYFYCYSYLQ